jgi:outer membrane receptor protein involved in Fe transport
MRNIFIAFCFILLAFSVSIPCYSQNITVSGKIISPDKSPVAFAAVSVLSLPDSALAKGGITSENGIFIIEGLQAGNYIAKIQSLGFKDFFTQSFQLKPNEKEKRLGIITISESIKRINEVEVVAEKPFVQQQADKRVYNVDKNITATGGTATDVLQNIPSVTQDADGNISLRGSENVNILINGKPSTIAGGDKAQILQQIPANTILSIEVITNPSSKYDAEGSSGIINIVTKRNEKENLSGSVGVNYTIYNKAGFNGSLNYKNKRFSIGGSYALNYNPRFFEGYNFRKNIFTDTTFSSEQIINGDRIPLNHNARFNGEYYISKRTTIGAVFSLLLEKSESPETTRFLNYDSNNYLVSEMKRETESERNSWNYEAGLNFRQTFKKPGRELTADATFSSNDRKEMSVFEDRYIVLNYANGIYPYRFSQNNINNGKTDQYIAQTDYSHSFTKTSKLETGLKSSIRKISGDYSLTNLDTLSGDYFPDSLNGWNTFQYTEQVYAAYMNYANKFKELSYQFGLRAEQTFIDGKGKSITTSDASVKKNYFNVFPTGFLAYTFKKEHHLQLSYSMRISRPWFRQLLPFVEVSDPYNLRIGNPNLKPELFHSIEFGWNKTFKQQYASASIYYRQTNNNIGRIRRVDAEGISTTTFENLNKQYSYGLELILRNQLFKWWDMTTGFNGFQSLVNGDNVAPGLSNSGFSYSVKNSMNFKFWKDAAFQVSTNYNGPMPTAQGKMKSVWNVDLALKKDVLKKKGTITINAQDIFFTRRFGFIQDQPTFEQDFWRRRESRVVTISFNYRFGSSENWSNRKKGRGGAPQDSGGDMMDY